MPKKDRVLLVQGGYVSQSQGKQLTLTNKKRNVLDKIPPRGASKSAMSIGGGSNAANNNTSNDDDDVPVPARVNVRLLLTFE